LSILKKHESDIDKRREEELERMAEAVFRSLSSVYRELEDFVRKHGVLVERIEAPIGEKLVYRYGRYTIIIDTAPREDADRIVSVMRGRRLIYISPSARRGSLAVLGHDIYVGISSRPKTLERVLRRLKRR